MVRSKEDIVLDGLADRLGLIYVAGQAQHVPAGIAHGSLEFGDAVKLGSTTALPFLNGGLAQADTISELLLGETSIFTGGLERCGDRNHLVTMSARSALVHRHIFHPRHNRRAHSF